MITSITMWLAIGERGLSSEAIALTTLGLQPTGWRASWPLDPADLRRCLLLLEASSPETRENGLLVLAKRSVASTSRAASGPEQSGTGCRTTLPAPPSATDIYASEGLCSSTGPTR